MLKGCLYNYEGLIITIYDIMVLMIQLRHWTYRVL